MITLKNVRDYTGQQQDLSIDSPQEITLEASHLTLLPALIDPHVHFRTPGHEYKEDWRTAAQAAIHGGYTTVFDMPNTDPTTVSLERLQEKKRLIDQQLTEINIPLRYHLYLGADKNYFDQFYATKSEIIGIKIFMGCSTGGLLLADDSSLHAAFALAAAHQLVVAVHAEDHQLIEECCKQHAHASTHDYAIHSSIRNPTVAATAVAKAITLAKLYQVKLYILHVSSQDELLLIKDAKDQGLTVYAETTPHHLFLSTDDYPKLQGQAQMNPPLRSKEHQVALFKAIREGTIDTIGSDHAPHTLSEKAQPYGSCPSGVPGIETTLPLLLNAYHHGLLTLDQIVALTSRNAKKIFNLPATQDFVLVDLNQERTVDNNQLKTKCGWSPFHGHTLKGWPVAVILRNRLY